jgi:hypothetical protein
MKKKFICGFAALAIGAVATFNLNVANRDSATSDVSLANVEALASGESGTGNAVTCYSSSVSKSGATYYDCGSCTRQFNSKGTGSSGTCTAN